MTYDGMEISDGTMASGAYFTMGEMSDPKELSRLRKALLDYCRQDTFYKSCQLQGSITYREAVRESSVNI